LLRHSYFIAKNKGEAAAKARWLLMQELVPNHVDGFSHYTHLLIEEGSYDEAEAAVGRGLERFPTDRGLLASRAAIARRRGDAGKPCSSITRPGKTPLRTITPW
jgi:hypothetical protein